MAIASKAAFRNALDPAVTIVGIAQVFVLVDSLAPAGPNVKGIRVRGCAVLLAALEIVTAVQDHA